jgi:hypothetical protein
VDAIGKYDNSQMAASDSLESSQLLCSFPNLSLLAQASASVTIGGIRQFFVSL